MSNQIADRKNVKTSKRQNGQTMRPWATSPLPHGRGSEFEIPNSAFDIPVVAGGQGRCPVSAHEDGLLVGTLALFAIGAVAIWVIWFAFVTLRLILASFPSG